MKGIVEGCNQSDCILLGGEVSLAASCLRVCRAMLHACCLYWR